MSSIDWFSRNGGAFRRHVAHCCCGNHMKAKPSGKPANEHQFNDVWILGHGIPRMPPIERLRVKPAFSPPAGGLTSIAAVGHRGPAITLRANNLNVVTMWSWNSVKVSSWHPSVDALTGVNRNGNGTASSEGPSFRTGRGQPAVEPARCERRGGIDFDRLEAARHRLGLETNGERWPSTFDDPALCRQVLGLNCE